MASTDYIQTVLLFGSLILMAPVLGHYMYNVFTGRKHFMKPVFGFVEKAIYKLSGIDPNHESDWKSYTKALLLFNFLGFLTVFLLLFFQSGLPFNPVSLPDVSWHLSFNTAVSFMTNTNWQSYAGETTLSYLTQMIGLTVQNFISAATGIAVMIALIRGLTGKSVKTLGNFWVDLTRSTLYILLPLSIFLSILLIGQGVIMNFNKPITAHTINGNEQIIPQGPAASQIAIKQLGTNGGGYFNANSAHPYENPGPFSNFLEMTAILLIPVSLTITYGKMTGSVKHGWIIFSAMMLMLFSGYCISALAEFSSNPVFGAHSLLEGKEWRNGINNSILWSTATTAASNGSVNAMHDSLAPLSGMVAMLNIMLGEIIFGGVGSGMYGMVIFILLTVFIAGLMVGRTPEYLGKKIGAYEIKMAMLAVLLPAAAILLFTAVGVLIPSGLEGLNNAGPHGFSEILYAFASAAGNNGSAFAGLNANTPFYNVMLGLGMLIGRFGVIIPVLAIAGSLVTRNITLPSAGTFRTDTSLFLIMLIAVILIAGGLTFFPALSLGPVVEHLLIHQSVTF